MITYAGFLPLVSFEQDGDESETSWFMFISSYSDKITKKSNEIKHAKITTPKLCFCRRQRCTTASRNPCKQRKSLMRMRSWGKPTSCRPSSLLPSWILRSLICLQLGRRHTKRKEILNPLFIILFQVSKLRWHLSCGRKLIKCP